MDSLTTIIKPIEHELGIFADLFNQSLNHTDGLLKQVLEHIRQRTGKRMRPILILLIAKNFGRISNVAQYAAVGLELLHTASLVHDDVVDESAERRGQASVNASFNNKVAVLVGDYLLSSALLNVAHTENVTIVKELSELGRTLASGELLQLSNIEDHRISEDTYYKVINQKTAALFESCCSIGALSSGADEDAINAARNFGRDLGIIFQIRDDIFDYSASDDIGKPTGNDMLEGKLTLPAIYVLNKFQDKEMIELAANVKQRKATLEEINRLVDYTVKNGGIEYAEQRMLDFKHEAQSFIHKYVKDSVIADALNAYLDYVINRKK